MKKSKPRSELTRRTSGRHVRTRFEQEKDHREKVPGRGTKSLTAIEKARIAKSS